MDSYTMLIDLGISFVELFLGKIKDKAPASVLQSLQATVDALNEHKKDLLTKANFEAQRG